MTNWLVYYCFPIIFLLFAWILESQLHYTALGCADAFCFFFDVFLRRNVTHSLFSYVMDLLLVCGKGERGNILGVIFRSVEV